MADPPGKGASMPETRPTTKRPRVLPLLARLDEGGVTSHGALATVPPATTLKVRPTMEPQAHATAARERIQKRTLLRASRSRVWRAITDPNELGAWFGLRIEGPFTPGARIAG